MKTLSLLTKTTLAILCVAGLSACGKKKGNNAAAVPAGYTTCTTGTNPYNGQPCPIGTTIYAGTNSGYQTCTTGMNPYTNQACQIGTPIYNNQYGYNQQYPGTNMMNGCQQYMYQGFRYCTPQQTQWGLMCACY